MKRDRKDTRILIYSHDTFGLGHLRRCMTIAHALVDRMLQGMGFEALNAVTAVLPDPGLPYLFGDSAPPPPQFTLMLALPPEAAAALQGEPDLRVTLTGTPDATLYDDAAAGAHQGPRGLLELFYQQPRHPLLRAGRLPPLGHRLHDQRGARHREGGHHPR